MSSGTESMNSATDSIEMVPRLSISNPSMETMPYARSRKLSRAMSTIGITGLSALEYPRSPGDSLSPGRRLSKPSLPLRRASQISTSGKASVDAGKSFSDSTRSTLPSLSESRRMNFSDVIIWRRLTRALKQRVAEKRTERRTFCWLGRDSMSRSGNNDVLEVQMEPTYRMEPETKLPEPKCRELIADYLKDKLKDMVYDAGSCKELSKQISDEIRLKVKTAQLLPPRYKCVVYVVLGEKQDQGIRVSSQSAWDQKTDSFVSESFQNGSIFCVVTLFAVYME